jgi:hypothetical protein
MNAVASNEVFALVTDYLNYKSGRKTNNQRVFESRVTKFILNIVMI